jgi:hypothetical protein
VKLYIFYYPEGRKERKKKKGEGVFEERGNKNSIFFDLD